MSFLTCILFTAPADQPFKLILLNLRQCKPIADSQILNLRQCKPIADSANLLQTVQAYCRQ